jgi:hypothetical protein
MRSFCATRYNLRKGIVWAYVTSRDTECIN